LALLFFSLTKSSKWHGLILYFNTNPLDWLITVVSSRHVLLSYFFPTILFIFLTVLIGRFFCGYVCPLGNLIDISDWIWIRRLRRHRNMPHVVQNLRWVILLILIGASIYGVSLLFFFEPMSIITRFVTLSVYTPIMQFLRASQDVFIKVIPEKWGNYNIEQTYYHLALLHLFIIVSILLLSLLQERFWCRFLCPLGLIYELLSKFSLLRVKVREDCPQCAKCLKTCPVAGERTLREEIPYEECLLCFECVDACSLKSISFKFMHKEDIGKLKPNIGLERRDWMLYLGLGLFSAWVSKSDASSKLRRLVRPPGAIPEEEFERRCIRCGACTKACPTHCLQPTLFQEGFKAIGTPYIDGYIAGCAPECNLCGKVCPTGAIRNLTLEEKQFAKLGMVQVNKGRCLAWAQAKFCLMCDEICPYNAIYRFNEMIDGKSIPVFNVVEDVCMGCGICAAKCAQDGARALKLIPQGEVRLASGSYITDYVIEERKRVNDLDRIDDDSSNKGEEKEEKPSKDTLFQDTPDEFKGK